MVSHLSGHQFNSVIIFMVDYDGKSIHKSLFFIISRKGTALSYSNRLHVNDYNAHAHAV